MAGPGLGLISSQPVGWLLFFTWPGTTPDTEEPGDGDPTGPSYAFLLGESLQDFHRKVCLNAPKARCPALRKFPSPSCPKCQRFMKLSVTALLTILKICKLPKCTLLGDCSDQTNQEIPRYRTTYGLLSNDAFISLFHCYACIMNLYDLRKCLWCALKEKQGQLEGAVWHQVQRSSWPGGLPCSQGCVCPHPFNPFSILYLLRRHKKG